jgi:CheY-like chemotaxis protein
MATSSKRVFVVDDDPEILEVMRDVLEDEGYWVGTAGHGGEALAKLRASAVPPCVILLDLMMPVMDGWAFRAEQSRDPALGSIPVVVLSADATIRDKITALRASGFLKKPFRMQELLDTVAAYG